MLLSVLAGKKNQVRGDYRKCEADNPMREGAIDDADRNASIDANRPEGSQEHDEKRGGLSVEDSMLSGEESQIHVERGCRACLDGEWQPNGFRAEPSRDGNEADDDEGVFGFEGQPYESR